MPSPKVVLLTNDFPPKVGGIQVVQQELYARLDLEKLWILASDHPGAWRFDAAQRFDTARLPTRTLLPTPEVGRALDSLIRRVRPDVVCFGSALPLSMLHHVPERLGVPYVPMVYGADASVPARIPLASTLLRGVLSSAAGIVALGPWVADCTVRACSPRRVPPICVVCPGVDVGRFTPGDSAEARARLGLDPSRPTVTSISRLVPRKGMRLLVRAAGLLRAGVPGLQVAIGGSGRERHRLDALVRSQGLGDTVTMLGRVPDVHLTDLYRAADVFTMLCHDRWAGLEREGFGIVFLEASACGVPVVAGRSGGAADAVADGVSGTVLDATDVRQVAEALESYVSDASRRESVGRAGCERVRSEFTWDRQAALFVAWMAERFG